MRDVKRKCERCLAKRLNLALQFSRHRVDFNLRFHWLVGLTFRLSRVCMLLLIDCLLTLSLLIVLKPAGSYGVIPVQPALNLSLIHI